ncbi:MULTISPECIES: LysR family transcriptional regulator [Vibrio]|uniref:LysR family transcriptional regulator n=1 Tax=Vibrio TaxID=662 RepID=UPI000C167C99|nr:MULTISPECIES: LysR family transcriptional regulator [Vibrio]NAW69188.1 LysR family transcriptional regulator [Vibrio sp. V28_P6S34P95]NAX03727.1 LysR family transcriptional regulator [Vibrio sp. V30_P3S12P165]NAX34539.1 LysR family transcriptional regulator [Vibrio sp. V29_P1S30P107]NAX38343.1 LysR family transcriptional regulator [Vibrio sp. V27_P1S3P104]NAX41492.1 LysR family transcriptional regulator [Vibrio sp. V26_P1S5P106]
MQDLSAIRAFYALCQYKSLTAAAKALSQPKSTLSRRITQLETDLAQTLVTRQGNKLSLTKAGEIFSVYAEQLLDLAVKGQEAIHELNNQVSGELTLVIHPSLIRGWMSKILDAFMQEHQHIKIKLHSQFQLAEHLLDPDLIIWVGPISPTGYHREPLGQWHHTVYASPDYLATHAPLQHPQELLHHPWIDFITVDHKALELHHNTLGHYTLPVMESRLQSDNLAMQADAIAKGRGVGLLPTWIANGFERAHPNSLSACLKGWKSSPIDVHAFYPIGRHPLRLRLLIEAVRQAIPVEWQQD